MDWNFIQSSAQMAIERAFGMLKGWWKILLKWVDMPLKHVPNLITTCLSLHNLCIIHKDNFNMQWLEEVIREMEHMKEKRERFWKFEGNKFVLHCGTSHPRHEMVRKPQITAIIWSVI